MARRTRARKVLGWLIPAVLVLAVVGWFGMRAVASPTDADRYTTATVGHGSVTQTLTATGTIAKSGESSVAFPAAGTVTAVKVAVGKHVSAGQVLAEMDNTNLRIAVITAKSALASAKLNLEQAHDAADAAASASASAAASASATSSARALASTSARPTRSTTTSSSSHSSSPTSTPSGSGRPSEANDIAKLTKTLHEAQAALERASASAAAALSSQQQRCATLTSTSPSPSASSMTPSGTPSPSETPTRTPSATASSSGADLADCLAAVHATQTAQQEVSAHQLVVTNAVQALAKAVEESSHTAQPGGSGQSSEPSRSTSATSGTGGTKSQQAQTRTTTSTSAQSGGGRPSNQGGGTLTVASANAAVTKADISLTTAETNLKAATMRSPISGVVSSVPFAKGDAATTSDKVVVIGKGSVEIELQVSEAAFRTIKVGQAAAISQPGTAPVKGTVSALGLLPTQSTTSATTTYPVTVTASGTKAEKLSPGATASVTLTLASAKDAVVVPVSAVTRGTTASNASVSVLTDGVAKTVAIRIGAVGSTTVEVTKGLTAGEIVILADHTTALPANSSNLNRRIAATGGGGTFNGPAAPGGGQPPR